MILIHNLKGKGGKGMALYRLQINNEIICQFKHRREDGLAACLRRAAEAIEQADDIKVLKILERLKEI